MSVPQGTHSTKTLSEVSGTGKKPWPQKHTGKARHGTLRGPQVNLIILLIDYLVEFLLCVGLSCLHIGTNQTKFIVGKGDRVRFWEESLYVGLSYHGNL